MKSKARFLMFLATLVCFSAAADVHQSPLIFRTISIPGATKTGVGDINNSNVMSGIYVDSNGVQHGMLLSGRILTTLDDPNGVIQGASLNNTGTVVGYYLKGTTMVGFEYQNGVFTDILPFGASNSFVGGVNDGGVMTGGYQDPGTGIYFGFYGPVGSYTSFQIANSTGTGGSGINNAGLIVATWLDSSGNTESSLFNPTKNTFTTINVPGAVNSYVNNINKHNQIVYLWTDASGNFHGAVRSKGTFTTIDDPNGTGTTANGINDRGVIGGSFSSSNFQTFQGFTVPFR